VLVDDLSSFLSGQSDSFVRSVEKRMREASERMDYEEAARLRDRWQSLTRALERNTVVFDDTTDADVIGTFEDDLQMAVQVFHVRAGRIIGERGFVLEKAEDLSTGGYVERALQRIYADPTVALPPREVLVASALDEPATVGQWLSDMRGSRVDIRVPQRGDKKTFMATAVENAGNLLRSHTARRSSDLTARSVAMKELQDALSLSEPPLRIECIDISTLQGQDTVASLVVFEDGLPRKSDYRSFIIRTPGADDLASVAEVVERRFARTDAPEESASVEPTRFAYPPALLVIDGGAPQVRAAQDALMRVGMGDLPVVGLAKRLEEVWLPGEDDPVILPRTSEALYLLQRVRDEAHRRAIGLHRNRRGKRSTTSVLDGVTGLGPARVKALRRHFGSIRGITAASVDEIQQVPGIGEALAATIHAALHPVEPNGP